MVDRPVNALDFGREVTRDLAVADSRELTSFGLRVLVEPLQVRVRGGGVEIEVVLLDILAVIALGTCETEVALLQDRIASIPQGEPEAETLVIVGDAEDAVLAPAIRARTRVVMREVVPGRAVSGVVLPHRSPLPVGQIGSPTSPVGRSRSGFVESSLLGRHG